jgi:DNA replication licensing factor MCM5
MDRQSVFSTRVFESNFPQAEESNLRVQEQLEAFILEYRLDNHFVYRYGRRIPKRRMQLLGC